MLVFLALPSLPCAGVRAEPPQEVRQLTHGRGTDYHPVFSPAGDEVLFASREGEHAALFRVPVGGGEPSRVPLGVTGDLYADWHPDGLSIVLDVREEGGPPDIFRYWLESGRLERLTDDPGMDGHPSLSPDGRQLVFTSTRRGSADLWVMGLDGGGLRRLTDFPGEEFHPQWSPAGAEILFSSDRDGEVDLWVVGLDGKGLRKIASRPGAEDRGAWSPDGSRVVFPWEQDLWLVDSGGGDPEPLTDFPGREGNPAWSPDGRSIAFLSDRSGYVKIWILTLR